MLNERKAKEDNVLLRLFPVLICVTELKSIFLRLRIQDLGVDLPTVMKFNVISATVKHHICCCGLYYTCTQLSTQKKKKSTYSPSTF